MRPRWCSGTAPAVASTPPTCSPPGTAALARGLRVVRVEQPWRVRGRRVAEAPARLDAAWSAVLADLDGPARRRRPQRRRPGRLPHRRAGRGAAACWRWPSRCTRRGARSRSRLPELLAPTVPRLVVQGGRDAFGVPDPAPGVEVAVVRGADHAFRVRKADARTAEGVAAEVGELVGHWLTVLLAGR